MIVSCSQPTYFGALNYFDLIDQADVFIIYNDVKFEKSSWQHRNYIKNQHGKHLLTVPTTAINGRMETKINEVLLRNCDHWQKKHFETIKQFYKDALYYKDVLPHLESLYAQTTESLAEWNTTAIIYICMKLGMKTTFIESSSLGFQNKMKDDRLVAMCESIGATEYLSSPGAKAYIDRENENGLFAYSKIKLKYQHYEYPVYDQLYNSYIAYLSVIDMLFNCGWSKGLEIIRSGSNDSF